jgi:hypothetical protein
MGGRPWGGRGPRRVRRRHHPRMARIILEPELRIARAGGGVLLNLCDVEDADVMAERPQAFGFASLA